MDQKRLGNKRSHPDSEEKVGIIETEEVCQILDFFS